MKRLLFRVLLLVNIVAFYKGYAESDAMENHKSSGSTNFAESLMKQPQLACPLLKSKIAKYAPLQEKILRLGSFEEKLAFISQEPNVREFFEQNRGLEESLKGMPVQYQYVVKALVALDQGPVVFDGWKEAKEKNLFLNKMIEVLFTTERFYGYMGGVVGYHVTTLQLILDALAKNQVDDPAVILPPPQVDIRKMNQNVASMVLDGIQSLEHSADVYVVGGAGDRLQLVDETTKEPLPVARLNFAGYSLLEQLVRDLEAREYLYYKLKGVQLRTPILLMTSLEKRNDVHIAEICEERGYFGRPKESIFRLLQPLAPVLCVDGNWAVSGPYELILKPGGHGVIWKLANEYGAFDWLQKQKRSYCLVRQINNPLAGLDYNLLALGGYGHKQTKAFGFESVPRLKGMSEGMNVLRQTKDGSKISCSISNIEYTEFAKRKEHDPAFTELAESGDFPANTNILFANIEAVKNASSKLPVPGFLVNMKHPVDTIILGQKITLPGARLESTMQNIADCITDTFSNKEHVQNLSTFVLLNSRTKTISVTKKAYDGKSIQETPEGCYYDLLQENLSLLRTACQFEINPLNSTEEYLKQGPSAIFLYNPALGPLYSVIGQKVSGGRLAANSELQIEAAEVSIRNLDVDGSLLITAENVTGAVNPNTRLLEFGGRVGHCILENVRVRNAGIDREKQNNFVKNRIQRKEACTITLKGASELIAKDVTINANQEIVVPDGMRAVLSQKPNGELSIALEPLVKASNWRYAVDKDNQIVLSLDKR